MTWHDVQKATDSDQSINVTEPMKKSQKTKSTPMANKAARHLLLYNQ